RVARPPAPPPPPLHDARPICEAAGDAALAGHVEAALSQVGYHAEEAGIIAARLTSSASDEDDPASRTELAMKLKARTRLGEDAEDRKSTRLNSSHVKISYAVF